MPFWRPSCEADPNFIALATNHAAEGMYGNPEYGGNQPPDRWQRYEVTATPT